MNDEKDETIQEKCIRDQEKWSKERCCRLLNLREGFFDSLSYEGLIKLDDALFHIEERAKHLFDHRGKYGYE